MKIKLEMRESDIIRSMKSNRHSPIQLCVSRYFNEDPLNVDISYDSITIWDDEINDYHSYKYCVEDIQNIQFFLDEWHDFNNGNLTDFCASPINFCVEQKK